MCSSLPLVNAACAFMSLWLLSPNAVLHQLADPKRWMSCSYRRMRYNFMKAQFLPGAISGASCWNLRARTGC